MPQQITSSYGNNTQQQQEEQVQTQQMTILKSNQ